MARITGGRAVVEAIEGEGVRKVFMVPGESLLTVLDGLYAHPNVEAVAARHEGGASYMALGYALASGRPGVCMAQRGPGAANLSIGLHCAHQDSVPIVALVTQVGSAIAGRESHQETDLVGMLRPHSKAVIELRRPDRVAEQMQAAFRLAQEGRPGVVTVVAPDDVLSADADNAVSAPFIPARPGLPADDADAVLDAIYRASHPVLMAGGGVQRAGAAEALQDLAELIGAPVLSWRHSVIADGHPWQVGVDGERSAAELARTDLFVVIGNRLNEDASLLHAIPPRGTPWIHIDLRPGPVYAPDPPATAIVADARRALEALIAAARTRPLDAARMVRRRAWKTAWQQAWELDRQTPTPHANSPLHPELVVEAMTRLIPGDAAVSVDIGNFVFWLRRRWRSSRPNAFFQSSAGSMGSGFSMAIGVQLAQPDQLVVAVAGDGGFMMSVPELETAVRLELPIIAVVFNNSMYGTIRWQQEGKFPGRSVATEYGPVDYARLAEATGAYGERVERAEDVEPAIRRAVAAKRTAVLDFVTDPNEIFPGLTLDELRRRARSDG